MSNVKVNGNTYNDVTSVKLALADGTGYATYAEGAVTSDITDILLSNEALGDMTNGTVSVVNLSVFSSRTCGTVNFTNAAEVYGSASNVVADNMLFPKVNKWGYRNSSFTSFRGCNISGTLDLSAITGSATCNQTFYGSTIGTLLLGTLPAANGQFQNATITNLVWNNPGITVGNGSGTGNMTGPQGLSCTGAKFTNVYVPDTLYDAVKAVYDAGNLTTVTNLYKISEWSGD